MCHGQVTWLVFPIKRVVIPFWGFWVWYSYCRMAAVLEVAWSCMERTQTKLQPATPRCSRGKQRLPLHSDHLFMWRVFQMGMCFELLEGNGRLSGAMDQVSHTKHITTENCRWVSGSNQYAMNSYPVAAELIILLILIQRIASQVVANDVTYSAAKKACARMQPKQPSSSGRWTEACELLRHMRTLGIKMPLGLAAAELILTGFAWSRWERSRF